MSHALRFLLTLTVAALYAGGPALSRGVEPILAQATTTDHADGHDHDGGHDHDDGHGHDDAHGGEHGRDDGHDDHGHGAGAEGTRLLVASAESAELVVLDLGAGLEIARFTTPGVGRVHQLPDDPRYAFVLHRDEHRVSVIHGGLSAVDHGDHKDLVQGSPYVLQTMNVGRQPTHFFARGHDIGIFNDQDGTIAVLDSRLLGISLEYAEIATAGPDHGSLSIVDGHVLAGRFDGGRVDVYDREGGSLATFDGCPGLHGQAVSGSTTVFGCSDGVLLVEVLGGGAFSSHRIDAPTPAPDGARVGTLVSDGGSGAVIGTFGDGLAIVDVTARTMTAATLAAAPIAVRFAEAGGALVVLTGDGMLHRVDPRTLEVEASVEVARPAEDGSPRPSLAALGEFAYVGDPERDRVVEVRIDGMEVVRAFELSVTPGGVAVMAIPDAQVR